MSFDENSHEHYRNHLSEFGTYLKQDWKRWAVMQIKQAMIQGKSTLYLFTMKKKDWKHGKTVLNFWKKNPISEQDQKYYHADSNVLITDRWLRTVIDFLTDIDLEWFPVATQNTETWTMNYNQIHAILKYPTVAQKI